MATQIPFAQFVLDEIYYHGWTYRPNTSTYSCVYLRHSMEYSKKTGNLLNERGNDDYSWFVTIFGAELYRGKEFYKIRLTKEEKRAFHAIDRTRKSEARLAKEDAWTAKQLAIEASQIWR